MLPILRRWQARWRLFRDSGERLKRRVEVEQHLLDCACGKRPLPDGETIETIRDALCLLEQSAGPFDEACRILRAAAPQPQEGESDE